MTNPIDYSLGLQYNPNAIGQGFATGNAILTLQQNRQLAEQEALAKQQAQQQAQIRQQQLAELMAEHVRAPSFKTASQLAMLLPKDQAEQVNKVYSGWDAEKQKNISGRTVGLEMALRKNPELGKQMLVQYRDALKESGDPDGMLESIDLAARVADVDPQSAIATLSGMNISALGADKYGSLIRSMGEESRAGAELGMKREELDWKKQVQERELRLAALDRQLKSQEIAISRMNAATGSQANQIKLAELQTNLQAKQEERAKLAREQQATAEGAFATIDSTIQTAQKLRDHPGFSGLFGAGLGARYVPGTDAAGAEAIFEQLQSKGFLAEIEKMKGLGALSEAEGKKLSAALVALNPSMPEKDAKKTISEIIQAMAQAKDRAAKKYGIQAAPATNMQPGKSAPTVSGW